MATIPTNRAAHQRINPNLRVGKPKQPVLSTSEQADIRKAISALQKAVDATDKTSFLLNASTAFHTIRNTMMRHK